MRILVWQWGRRGAGPRVAAELAAGLRDVGLGDCGLGDCGLGECGLGDAGSRVFLSLSRGAEILASREAPECALLVQTYDGMAGYLLRLLTSPVTVWPLIARIRALAPDVAICAMPGPLDLVMAWALRWLGVKILVTVHDADLHPGDGFPMQMTLQTRLIRRADALIALTSHVAARLREQPAARGKTLLMASLPPFVFGHRPPPPLAHGGPMRLLCFGRLLPYKGFDLLEAALRGMPSVPPYAIRIVGEGPESDVLDALARLPGVTVENRWVPEDEIATLIAWADAVVLPYREASQSGVAAIAIAANRWVVATRVGGLSEQFRDEKLALLCDPEPVSIRQALSSMLLDPPPLPPPLEDPRARWREMADRLQRQSNDLLFSAPAPAPAPLLSPKPTLNQAETRVPVGYGLPSRDVPGRSPG